MPESLDTTNTMLAIIAGVMVFQALVLIGVGIAGWKLYRTATETIREIDERRVKPIVAKVDGVLDRVHQITDRVQRRAERVEAAIDDTVGRVSHTATDVKSNVSDTVHRVTDVVTGLRAALVNALTTDEGDGHRHHSRFAHDPSVREHLHHGETRDVREGGL